MFRFVRYGNENFVSVKQVIESLEEGRQEELLKELEACQEKWKENPMFESYYAAASPTVETV